jgi:cell division protein FtsB
MNFLILEEITSEITSEIIEATSEVSSEGASIPSAVQPVADWIKQAWEWCNQPLPIVGISLITIIIFLWRVLVSTNYGKKTIKKLQTIADDTKTATDKTLEEMKAENENYKKQIEDLQAQIELAKGVLSQVCTSSRNKQVKELADMLKETTEDESEEVTDNGGEESQEGTDGNPDEE